VETWTYQNINSVFHNPDTLELSHEEKMELAKKQKIIKHDNTRLTKLPWKTDKQVRPYCENQCSGSGIRRLFDRWIRDPGWVKSGFGTGMNNPYHIS
jgi:hypothetical protein